jgi:hypothetical protein
MTTPSDPLFQKVFQMPKNARPSSDLFTTGIGGKGEPVPLLIRADGWVLANPEDSPISLDGVSYSID